MIKAIRLYTGPDGHSHFVKGTIEQHVTVNAHSIHFEETPAHSSLDWHNAPTSQYVIVLSGVLEFTMHDGQSFTIRPGEVLIALDTTGSGHKWRLVDDQPWRRAYVAFGSNEAINFQPE